MGQTRLEEKLQEELISAAELTEARLVYMLVCVRKLMEIGGTQYPSLRFHCDWALHSRLDRKEAVRVIKLFDDLEDALANEDSHGIERARRAVDSIVNVQNFRNELGEFLTDHQMPNSVCILAENWIRFLDVYMRIISDVPLEFNSTPIRHIRKVVVKHIKETEVPDPFSQFVFGLEWTPERFDSTPAMPHGLSYQISR